MTDTCTPAAHPPAAHAPAAHAPAAARGRTGAGQPALAAAGGPTAGPAAYDGHAEDYLRLLTGRRAGHLADTIAHVRALLPDAHRVGAHHRDREPRAVAAAAPRPTGAVLVDLACGPGLVTAALIQDGWTVLGVDASSDCVRLARQRGLPAVLLADAADTGLPAGLADVVVSTYSHTDVESWPGLVNEAHRLLRPGGRLVYVGAHPAFVGPHARREPDPDWPARVAAGYYHRGDLLHAAPGWRPGALRARVGARHHTLAAFLAPVLAAGWRLDELHEDAADPPTLIALRATALPVWPSADGGPPRGPAPDPGAEEKPTPARAGTPGATTHRPGAGGPVLRGPWPDRDGAQRP